MKKLLSVILIINVFLAGVLPSFAGDCGCCENLSGTGVIYDANKKAPCNSIGETENYYILYKGNVIKAAFEYKFMSECVQEGDCVYFYVPKDIRTTCGELVIPMGSKLTGFVRGVANQKKFNKNARVHLSINKLILPDCTEVEVKAKPFSKDFSLVENGWMTAGKIAASTVGLGAVGAGTGVGLAFIPKPHKIAIGAGSGVAIGCFIGLVTGLVTPGLKYHAKAGEEINIIFCDDACIPKEHVDESCLKG